MMESQMNTMPQPQSTSTSATDPFNGSDLFSELKQATNPS